MEVEFPNEVFDALPNMAFFLTNENDWNCMKIYYFKYNDVADSPIVTGNSCSCIICFINFVLPIFNKPNGSNLRVKCDAGKLLS